MIKHKVIKTQGDYKAALAQIESLMGARPGTPEEEELELLAVLTENYEREHFPIGLPDPVEAIKFRMEQEGLARKDLVPYIGNASKVSEVLNHKRPLSMAMIRALHEGLAIPAEVLLQKPDNQRQGSQSDHAQYPFAEMLKRGYFGSFKGTLREAKEHKDELLEGLFAFFQGHVVAEVHSRSSTGSFDKHALQAWQARVLQLASGEDLPSYSSDALTPETIRDVVKLSSLDKGPLHAQELLQKRGIPLVILQDLPHTYLDGACFKSPSGHPVIGLTLRHDRQDNFWFTLVHELAHVYLHLVKGDLAFFDDTEPGMPESDDPKEREANAFAANALVPLSEWKKWRRQRGEKRGEEQIKLFAARAGVSPAIVAGRLRWETGDYKSYAQLLGNGTVRKVFASEG
jgi:HTH-type transcriptional regulator/antitoxin HigA